MLCITDLSKTFYPNTPNEIRALQEVNLEVGKGEYVVLLGANGSGKSTLLNLIAGTYYPSTGKIQLAEKDISTLPDYRRSKWIARIFQNPLQGTSGDLSVLENFRLASLRTKTKTLQIGNNKHFKQEVQEKIAALGMNLENKILQTMASLSGGQRQALTLLMATMDTAKLLLMDEPTAALDPKSAYTLMEKATEIIGKYQLTALLITHNLKDAHQYGTRIVQMQQGKIIRDKNEAQKKILELSEIRNWFD